MIAMLDEKHAYECPSAQPMLSKKWTEFTVACASGFRYQNWCVFRFDTIQYIPRNMHTVLLCFALLWLCNRS